MYCFILGIAIGIGFYIAEFSIHAGIDFYNGYKRADKIQDEINKNLGESLDAVERMNKKMKDDFGASHGMGY